MPNTNVFVRADSTNLPNLTNVMILEYINTSDKHNIAEIRGAKVLMSSRHSYLDTAVGFVEVQRSTSECIVRAKVVPEHKITTKNYTVTVNIDENENIVRTANCDQCPAAAGGCKHSLVVLFWLCKKTEEPSSTSVECYWRKPSLKNASAVPVLATDIFKNSKKIKLEAKNYGIVDSFLEKCHNNKIQNSLIVSLFDKRVSFNIFDMALEFSKKERDHSFNHFKKCMDKNITVEVVKEISYKTANQVGSKLWHNIRQGRITASKLYEASKCNTDGTLVQQILGGYKVPETVAIKRGKNLENEVIQVLEKKLHIKIKKVGIILLNSIIGASPDGLCEDFVVEVKCPLTTENLNKYYIDKNNVIMEKCKAQIQLQMLVAARKRGILCVADPCFESNKKIYIHFVDFDQNYIDNILKHAENFWKKFIFTKIMKSVL